MFKLYQVITNAGDGSNGLTYTLDPNVIMWMQERAEDGYEQYMSGDGLQVKEFKFKSKDSLDEFIDLNINKLSLCQLEDCKMDGLW